MLLRPGRLRQQASQAPQASEGGKRRGERETNSDATTHATGAAQTPPRLQHEERQLILVDRSDGRSTGQRSQRAHHRVVPVRETAWRQFFRKDSTHPATRTFVDTTFILTACCMFVCGFPLSLLFAALVSPSHPPVAQTSRVSVLIRTMLAVTAAAAARRDTFREEAQDARDTWCTHSRRPPRDAPPHAHPPGLAASHDSRALFSCLRAAQHAKRKRASAHGTAPALLHRTRACCCTYSPRGG